MLINGVVFYEDTGSRHCTPIFRRSRMGSEAIRSWQLRSTSGAFTQGALLEADKALLGCNLLTTSGGGKKYIRRKLPHGMSAPADLGDQYVTNHDGVPYLWLSAINDARPISPKVDAEAVEEDTDQPAFQYGIRYQCAYTSRPYRLKEDSAVLSPSGVLDGFPDEGSFVEDSVYDSRFISRRQADEGRTITVQPGMVKWDELDENGKRQGVRVSLPVPENKSLLILTWHCVPVDAIPFAAIRNCRSKVNDRKLDGWPAENLIFRGYTLDPFPGALGVQECDIHYHFATSPSSAGWNAWPRTRKTAPAAASTLEYERFSADGSGDVGKLLIKLADMSTLFRPDQS